MAKLKLLVGSLAFVAFSASAFYTDAVPPAVYKTVGGVGYLSASASDISFANGIRSKISGAGSLAKVALAGGGGDIPVAYKFAATAGKAAASLAFGWPGAMLLAGGLAYQYFTDNGLIVEDGIWKKNVPGSCAIVTGCPQFYTRFSTYHFMYNTAGTYVNSPLAKTQLGSCEAAYAMAPYWLRDLGSPSVFGTACKFGDSQIGNILEGAVIPYSPPSKVPVTKPEMESIMEPKAVPVGVPQAWPVTVPMWWPVLDPILSPSPQNPADPLAVPIPTPTRVPQGNPVPVPNTNPQQYTSPVVDIVPSPTLSNPWRVDVQPKEITSLSPDPLTTAPVPETPASGTTAAPAPAPTITCGLPGTPPCKIDETSTPEIVVDTVYVPKADAVKASKDTGLEQMKTGGGSLFGSWGLFFSAPAFVACSPVVLPSFQGASMGSIDPCPVVDGVRSVMAYIWAFAGLMLCLGMIRKTVH